MYFSLLTIIVIGIKKPSCPIMLQTHQAMKSLFFRISRPKLSLNRFNLLSVGFIGRTDLKVNDQKIENKLSTVSNVNAPFTLNPFIMNSVEIGKTT